jgi:myo-inositol-1(or 4)-monophosphatase
VSFDLDNILALMQLAAKAAGAAALKDFREGARTTAAVRYKAGDSPVSDADMAANAVLENALCNCLPGVGWISEETITSPVSDQGETYFVVDPIDGTRAFISGDKQWSVAIGFVLNGKAVAGVVHAPSLGLTYAARQGGGARRNGMLIRCSDRTDLGGARLAGPLPLLDKCAAISGAGIERMPKIPSLALRLAAAATGDIDLALATSGAHAWDIAAADAILSEAGGCLMDTAQPVSFGAPPRRYGLLAAGSSTLVATAIDAFELRKAG